MKRILEIGPHFYVTDGKRTFQVATKQLALDICKSAKDIEEAYRETVSPAYREGDYVLAYAENSLRKVHRVVLGPIGWAYMLGGEDGPYFDNELYPSPCQPSALRNFRNALELFDKVFVISNTFDDLAIHGTTVSPVVQGFLAETGCTLELIQKFEQYAEIKAAEMYASNLTRTEVYVVEGTNPILKRAYLDWAGFFQLYAPENVRVTSAWSVMCADKRYTFLTEKTENAIFYGTWQDAVEFISAINGGDHE